MGEKFRTVLGEVETSTVGKSGDTPGVLDPALTTTITAPLALEHQVIESEGHPYRLLGRSRENIGGPFTSHKVEIDLGTGDYGNVPSIISWSNEDRIDSYHVSGRVIPGGISSLLTSTPSAAQIRAMCPLVISDSDLDEYGATAISLCAPRSPLADASSTIGELRDGLPSIPNPTKNIGGEYLNVVFGLQPIASELSAYYQSWRNAEKLLDQLEKDSGKWIRRGFHFDPIITSSEEVNLRGTTMVHGQTPPAINVDGGSRYKRRTHTETKIWFAGCFAYHLPKGGWRRKMEELDYLYGVKPGIDTAWELMPWSWLVDWYSNIGDVLHNINAFGADGLVMPYGYIMATTTRTVSYHLDLWYQNAGGVHYNNDPNVLCSITYTTKQRRLANPFGFGLSWESLSPRQGAILAALGISRA